VTCRPNTCLCLMWKFQLHYRQDLLLGHNLNCSGSVGSNLSVSNSFQLATRKPDNCETCILLPSQNMPDSPPPPATDGKSHSNSLVAPKSRRSVSKLTRTNDHNYWPTWHNTPAGGTQFQSFWLKFITVARNFWAYRTKICAVPAANTLLTFTNMAINLADRD
jgi:hypothetical protein